MTDDDYDLEDTTYLPKRKPEPKTTARSYIESQVQPFLKSFNWKTETLEKDMKAFWIAIHRLNKYKPTYLRETLEWAAKNRLHPLAFVKACNTILRK